MTIPGFTAEASLTKTMCKYGDSILLGRVGPNAVLPMQGVPAAPFAENFAGHFPYKRVWCCTPDCDGKIYCSYSYVPIWYVCEDISHDGPSCLSCHPPDLFAQRPLQGNSGAGTDLPFRCHTLPVSTGGEEIT